jgi:uncharacterized protein (TIGR02611 family)
VSVEERQRPLLVRALIVIAGFLLLAVGGALMVLPGPGIPVVAAGLGLLSLEFVWARRVRDWVLTRAARVAPKRRHHRIALGVLSVVVAIAAFVAVTVWGIPGL